MMLNELILARGYILAPMLPAAEGTRRTVAKPQPTLAATIMAALRRCFGRAAG